MKTIIYNREALFFLEHQFFNLTLISSCNKIKYNLSFKEFFIIEK